MQAAKSSEMPVYLHLTTRRQVPEDSGICSYCRDKLDLS